jgi:hypothetical protein
VVDDVNAWVTSRLTVLNHGSLAGRYPSDAFGKELATAVLGDLPHPEVFSADEARRMVVLLGLAGASLARHYQERDPSHRATPERAFDPYPVGGSGIPFLTYFNRLVDVTGTGHCRRDGYASLVRWNVPLTEVVWAGQRLAALPSVFDDGLVRTYTGAPDERRFFELVKVSETIELAANSTLAPLYDDAQDVTGDDATRRVLMATVLLEALRRVNSEFAARPPETGMRPNHFMDVFRQFAVHWTAGDIPPSGALDPEAIIRDFILGTTTPQYLAHLERLLPGLLANERDLVADARARPTLPELVLKRVGLDQTALTTMSERRLREAVAAHPVLPALYLLLNAHARASGVHLLLAKKFLFAPQRQREAAGRGDRGVVSNRRGTTGMDEVFLEQLTRQRHRHCLGVLRRLGTPQVASVAGLHRVRAEAPADLTSLVRIVIPFREGGRPGGDVLTATGVGADDEAGY